VIGNGGAGREFGEHGGRCCGLHPGQFVGDDADDGQKLRGAERGIDRWKLGVPGEGESTQCLRTCVAASAMSTAALTAGRTAGSIPA